MGPNVEVHEGLLLGFDASIAMNLTSHNIFASLYLYNLSVSHLNLKIFALKYRENALVLSMYLLIFISFTPVFIIFSQLFLIPRIKKE